MDRHQAMETFIRVVETGSFSAAARMLRVGQPAVSKAVAGLEERLGVRLLVRTTRRMHPTDAGYAFYERAVRALVETEEAEAAARGLGRSLEGRLRVCAPVTFARLHIAPRLDTFLTGYPKLSLEVVMDDRNIDLVGENIDVALRLGMLRDSSLSARKLASAPRHVVGSAAYVARRGTPITPADLRNHDAIVYARAGGEEWRFRKGASRASVRIISRLAFSAAEGVREAVIAGLGLAIASRWMMEPELASGTVVSVLDDWLMPEIDLWAVFPAGRMPSARARAFADWCAEIVKVRSDSA